MSKLQAVITCTCGDVQFVDTPEGGQSLFGTACWQSMRHNEVCRGKPQVKARFNKNE